MFPKVNGRSAKVRSVIKRPILDAHKKFRRVDQRRSAELIQSSKDIPRYARKKGHRSFMLKTGTFRRRKYGHQRPSLDTPPSIENMDVPPTRDRHQRPSLDTSRCSADASSASRAKPRYIGVMDVPPTRVRHQRPGLDTSHILRPPVHTGRENHNQASRPHRSG